MKYSIKYIEDHFKDEKVCKEYLHRIKWENGDAVCPKCNNTKTYWLASCNHYICADRNCRKKFSLTSGTIFENTKIPLSTWFTAIHLLTTMKRGFNSIQLSEQIGVTQKTAWFMAHRIRESMSNVLVRKLRGIIEIDETYVGGKSKNKHKHKRKKGTQGRSLVDKMAILGLKERGGNIITIPIDDVSCDTIQPLIEKYVEGGAIIHTDEWKGYNKVKSKYEHFRIHHGNCEYVREDIVTNSVIHTNSIESHWAVLKRGIIGVYYWISFKHRFRYNSEFTFRHNMRKASMKVKFDFALASTIGKRLKYDNLTAQMAA